MTSPELYRKLRPFLGVKYVCSTSYNEPKTEHGRTQILKKQNHGYYGIHTLVWKPKLQKQHKSVFGGESVYAITRRPTYEEFCHWYGLELEAL